MLPTTYGAQEAEICIKQHISVRFTTFPRISWSFGTIGKFRKFRLFGHGKSPPGSGISRKSHRILTENWSKIDQFSNSPELFIPYPECIRPGDPRGPVEGHPGESVSFGSPRACGAAFYRCYLPPTGPRSEIDQRSNSPEVFIAYPEFWLYGL